MTKPPLIPMVLSALAASSPGFCEDGSLYELQRRCEAARESKIAPLREAAIEDCVSRPRTSRTREDCERMNKDFGGGGGTLDGGFRPSMFMDLPECVEYVEARDRQEGSRSSR